MYNLNWTTSQGQRFWQLLLEPHRVAVWVHELATDHRFLRDLSGYFMDGEVTMDTTGDVSRSCEINLVDPYHQLGLDPGDPGTSVFVTRMIQIYYWIGELDGSFWYQIPLFCGPINKVDRDGVFLDIECHGKEALAAAGIWNGTTYKKGQFKVEVIKSIMHDLGGENMNKMNIHNNGAKLKDDLTIKRGGDRTPWKQTKKLASSMGMQAYYDGGGVLQVQPWSNNIVFQFDERFLTTPIQVSYNLDDMVNAVQLTGGTPKGAKDPIVSRAVAPPSHPLSAWALGRNGVPRFLTDFETDDDITDQSDLDDKAFTMLSNHLMGAQTVATDSMVIPQLEEGDLVAYATPYFYGVNRLNKFNIPLTGAPIMSLGYDDKYRLGKLRRRRKKHHKGKGGKGADRRVP